MILIFFITGLIIGSFLGVVNWRLKTAEDIVWKRSYCPHCKHEIHWYDNIPLLSFVILRGECRDCRKKISLEYPIVELMTGLLFAGAAWKFLGAGAFWGGPEAVGLSISGAIDLAFFLFAICYLVVVFFHDYDFFLIPDAIVFPGLAVTFIFKIWKHFESPFFLGDWHSPLVSALFGALVGGGFFLALVLVSKGKWIGGGDVKLGLLAGAILGWPQIVFALFFAYASGSVVSLALIAAKKKTWKSKIAFGPFIIAGIWVMMFFGERVQFWANRYMDIGY